MAWCLIKSEADKFKRALVDGSINPIKLSEMSSEERHDLFLKYTNEANALKMNSLFESKLLLKNQKRGFITWAKRITNITPATKFDLLSKIERMDKVLSTAEEGQFLRDLATTRLKLGVTQAEVKIINDLTKNATESKAKANKDGIFPSETQRLKYGMDAVNLENFINELKLDAKKMNFKEDPLKYIYQKGVLDTPGNMKSLVASIDNSFFGRQGIKTLLDPKTSKIWLKAFLQSWKNIKTELKGNDAMNLVKADIYSRPNAINGKYAVGGFGLNILHEEAFPTSAPGKIPAFGRLFKASESAYSGGALTMRADLADRMIKIGEQNGLNMLNKDDAIGMGRLVQSMTGRGSIGKAETISKELNVLLFSVKFFKSNFDTLTAHMTDPKVRQNPVARKEAVKHLARVVTSVASILMMANFLDPDSVDEDSRSTNFGKIKIWGKWIDITGGMGGIARLAMRVMPTQHDGEWGQWSKSSTGRWTNLRGDGYKVDDAWDMIVDGVFNNKLSPMFQLIKSAVSGKFFGGDKFTPSRAIYQGTTPLVIQNTIDLMKDPTAEFVFGTMLFEAMGFSVSSYPEPNKISGVIPTETVIKNDNFINMLRVYGKAFGTDPETAFNRVFTGQKIYKVEGGVVILERDTALPVKLKKEYQKEYGGTWEELRVDHTVPIEMGGSDLPEDLVVMSKTLHGSYTAVEIALIKAIKQGKITKKEGEAIIREFKAIGNKKDRVKFGEEIRAKYK